jgi:transcriptional regulator with XRE-family HTH domain
MSHLGDYLKELRLTVKTVTYIGKKEINTQGLSQDKAAHFIGITPAGVSMIETGRRSVSLKTVFKICDFYEIAPEILIEKARLDYEESDNTNRVNEITKQLANKMDINNVMKKGR